MRFICASILDANASICARARTSEEAPEAGTGTGLGGTGGSTGRVSAGGSTGRVGAGTVASPEGLWFVLRSIPADASSVGVARARARGARGIRGEFFGRDIPSALAASNATANAPSSLLAAPASARQTSGGAVAAAPIHARFRPRSARVEFAPPSDPLARPIRRRTPHDRPARRTRPPRARSPPPTRRSRVEKATRNPIEALRRLRRVARRAVQHLHHDHHEFVLRDVFEDDVGGERDGRFDGRFQARFRARARVDDPRVGLRRRPDETASVVRGEAQRDARRDAATARRRRRVREKRPNKRGGRSLVRSLVRGLVRGLVGLKRGGDDDGECGGEGDARSTHRDAVAPARGAVRRVWW